LAKTFEAMEKSGTRIYVIPGNHDILNPWARGFRAEKQYVTDWITQDEFRRIYADFGYKEAISKDKNSLSYLAAPSKDLWLLMLDTCLYQDNLELGHPKTDGILSSATLQWIAECAARAKEKGASIITAMHHNILDHSEIVRTGYTLSDSDQAQIIYKENDINLVFSGHIHAQDISSDHNKKEPLYDIASNALSVYPHQYGVLNYSREKKTLDYHTRKLDVATWAQKNGITDSNLLNFNSYAKEYFGQFAYNKAMKNLLMETDYSKDKMQKMADTMRELNLRYFAGTENENSEDIIQSEGYQLWMNSPENNRQRYIKSVITDKDMDDNELHIDLKQ
jgi:3',5'-cyclic AMP phosphodiesterase CpdA